MMTLDCENALFLASRKLDGPLTAEEEAGLSAHLLGCPGCSDAVARMGRVDRLLARALPRTGSREREAAAVMAAIRPPRMRISTLGAAAAAVLLVWLIAEPFRKTAPSPAPMTASAPVGRFIHGKSELRLLDPAVGAWARLMTDSPVPAGATLDNPGWEPVRLDLIDGGRLGIQGRSSARLDAGKDGSIRMALSSGELFVDSPMRKAPLFVEAAGLEVRIVGTAFGVRLSGAVPSAYVVRGRVRVSGAGREVILEPGEEARLEGGELSVSRISIETAGHWVPWPLARPDVEKPSAPAPPQNGPARPSGPRPEDGLDQPVKK